MLLTDDEDDCDVDDPDEPFMDGSDEEFSDLDGEDDNIWMTTWMFHHHPHH